MHLLSSNLVHQFSYHLFLSLLSVHTVYPKMPSLYNYMFLLTLSVSKLASAEITGKHVSSGSFRVEQVAKANSTSINGLVSYAKVLRKYAHHANSTDDVLSKAAALVEASSVVTTPVEGDALYITPVTIGSQVLELDIDTGSSDL